MRKAKLLFIFPLFILLSLLFENLLAQPIAKITNIEQIDNSLIITYKLVPDDNDNLYSVKASYEIFGQEGYKPIKNAWGFIGNNISPGKNKRIVWKYSADLNNLTDVKLKIKLTIDLQPPFKMLNAYYNTDDIVPIGEKMVIYFPKDLSHLNWNYYLNSESEIKDQLKALIDDINLGMKMGLGKFDISIEAWESPNPEPTYNNSLSESRLESIGDYLFSQIGNFDLKGTGEDKNFKELASFPMTWNGPDWNGFIDLVRNSKIEDKTAILNVLRSSPTLNLEEQEVVNMILIYPELDSLIKQLDKVELQHYAKVENPLLLSVNPSNSTEIENAMLLIENEFTNLSEENLFNFSKYITGNSSKLALLEQIKPEMTHSWRFYNEYSIGLMNKGLHQDGLAMINVADSIFKNSLNTKTYNSSLNGDQNSNSENPIILNNIAIANYFHGNNKLAEGIFQTAFSNASDIGEKQSITNNFQIFSEWQSKEPIAIAISDNYFTVKPYILNNEAQFLSPSINKYAIIIGISDYLNLDPPPDTIKSDVFYDLKYAHKDAERFYEILNDVNYFGDNWKIIKLINEQATLDTIYNSLSDVLNKATKDDIIYIFYSGHGDKDINDDTYLLSYGSNPAKAMHPGQAIYYKQWFKEQVIKSRSDHIILFVDACYSGSLDFKGGPDVDFLAHQLLKEKTSKIAFTSSTNYEKAKENDILNGGLFSHFLLKGLKGEAEDNDYDAYVNSDELVDYLNDSIGEFQMKHFQKIYHRSDHTQTPSTSSSVPISIRQ